MIFCILGKALLIEAILLALPMFVGFYYADNNFIAFLVPILILLIVGIPLSFVNVKDKAIYAKEGFVTVALVWIVMSIAGCLPFVVSGEIPNFINAFFETVSGFTTTGASILTGDQIDNMSKSLMFWRLFTHWIGGMGVLVFVLAVVPSNSAGVMHVFRAESPGPSVGKLVSKLSFTARILYAIYFSLTLLQIVLLLCGGNSVYESILLSFTTAGTGGFALRADGAGSYSLYTQMVLAVFMFLFSLNFNFYYLILIRSFAKAFKSEEIRAYFIIVFVSTLLVSINILGSSLNFGDAVSKAFFQVASISSTTGLTSANYDVWPEFSKGILIILTIIGACGGSTGGGIKVSRLMILFKSSAVECKKLIHPRAVVSAKFEGETIDKDMERQTKSFIIVWLLVVLISTLLLSLDAYGDLFSDLTATLACIGNVGPGFGAVGPVENYLLYSDWSKILLSGVMLIGRLEIFPMLILFAPRTWRRG